MRLRSPSTPVFRRGSFFVGMAFILTSVVQSACSSEENDDPYADTDGDGVPDQLGTTFDLNDDGTPDDFDVDGDGEPDGIGVDTDGDGKPDGVAVDVDGDGVIDGVDTTGDGKPDVIVDTDPDNSGGTGGGDPSGSGGSLPTTGPFTPGINSTVQDSLPDGEPVACEWDWTIRLLAPFQHNQEGHAPRRMYNATCGSDTPNPRMYTSYTVGTKVDAGLTGTSGAITETVFNPATEKMEVGATHHFPECRSMHGVAAGADCGVVAALCRIENTAPGSDHDAVAGSSSADWMTNENLCGEKMNDHMWLYEWPDGDLSKDPVKVIVHKSIGSWEYGSNYLRFGENDNTYGIALKATVGEGTDCHEADSYMVLDRSDYSLTNRGWDWACATGHTVQNRPAYDPSNKKYGMLCSTDWNKAGTPNEVEVAFHREDQPKALIQHLSRYNALWIKGGAGPLIPRDGGGFLGLLVGEPLPLSSTYDDTVPTQIGLVSYDTEGEQVGEVRWIASNPEAFLSWPQLVALGGDRYLVGWGEGYHVGTKGEDNRDRNLSFRIPWSYHAMEISGDGEILTAVAELEDAGWGEMNEMVPLGEGRVAWSYVPEDRRDPTSDEAPPCNQDSLVHYVYTSSGTSSD